MIKRNDSQISDSLRVTASFIIEEKEEVIFLDRPADASAKLVPGQLGPRNAFAGARIDCPVVEKSICRCQRGTVELTQRPVKIVGAAFGNHLNLTAAAATFGGAWIGRDGSKFLNRIDGGIADCRRKLPSSLVIGVDSVNGDVSLVGARAGDGAYAVDACGPEILSDNAGLQTYERGRGIANLNRKFLQPARADDIADTGVGRIQGALTRGRDCDSVGNLSDGHLRVDGLRDSDAERDIRHHDTVKTLSRKGEFIARSWRHLHERVNPLFVRLCCLLSRRLGVGELHVHTVDHRSRGVRHYSRYCGRL